MEWFIALTLFNVIVSLGFALKEELSKHPDIESKYIAPFEWVSFIKIPNTK